MMRQKEFFLKKARRIFCLSAFAFVFLFVLTACAASPSSTQDYLSGYTSAGHLVFIGLDGWGGVYTQKADMPTVKRMMAEGSSTLEMLSVMPSVSLNNWTALFSGIKIKKNNSYQSPSIFTLINESGHERKTILFYEWEGFLRIIPEETVEKCQIQSDLESTMLIADYIIETKPFFTAIIYNQPDGTGHNKRWGSADYYARLTELDGYIAIIEQAVKDAGIYEDTVFVLSSDHGGVFWGHGFFSRDERRIPLIIYGKNIKEGYVIKSPGKIYNITPTMAAILGLRIPSEWMGKPLLEVF